MLSCRLGVLPHGATGTADDGTLRLRGVAVALVTLASAGILLSRTLELNGGAWRGLLADMWLAIKVTHFGHVWRWRVPLLVLLWLACGAHARERRQPWNDVLMVIAAAGIALTRSQTGHPADHGDFELPVWVDWGHLLAAGAWVGSLFAMSLAVYPGLVRAGERGVASATAMFQHLSTLSGAALVVLLGCGSYNAVHQLGSVDPLWSSRYGLTLDIKLLIVLAMIAIGAHNRYVKLPRLLRRNGQDIPVPWSGKVMRHVADHGPTASSGAEVVRQCARAVLIESLLGLAVIGTTSVLLHAMPPAARPHEGMEGKMGVRSEVAPAEPQDAPSNGWFVHDLSRRQIRKTPASIGCA